MAFRLGKMLLQGRIQQCGSGFMISVRAAFGFGDDAVHAAQFAQVLRR